MNYGRVHAIIKKYYKYRICDIIIALDAKVTMVDKIHKGKKSTLLDDGYIFILSTLTLEQKKYYLLHELAHLAMHRFIADRLKIP